MKNGGLCIIGRGSVGEEEEEYDPDDDEED